MLRPFDNGAPVVINGTTFPNTQIGGAGYYDNYTLKSSLRSNQFFARLDYDLTDNVHAFAYGAANLKRNLGYTTWLALPNMTLSSNNAFLSPQYKAILAAAGPTFTINRTVDQGDAGSRLGFEQDSRQFVAVVGLTGKAGGATWNLAYNHGDALLDIKTINNLNQQRLAASLDAVLSPTTGQPVCAASLTNPSYANCVPFNPFGPTATSDAALHYVLGNTDYKGHTYLDDLVADVSGSPLEDWAGPITLSLSAEWRRERFTSTTDADPSALANCTGLNAKNCPAGTFLWSTTFGAGPPIQQTVWEVATEVEAPLLKDAPLAKSLSFNGAARYTHYDTSGSYVTWKLGVVWAVNDALRFRGTISRDIRAPTPGDLYAPAATVITQTTDFLIPDPTSSNGFYQAIVQQTDIGNSKLTAEIGRTKTIGVVWQPGFIPGFSASVDFYDIVVTNAIVRANGFNQNYQNACYDSGGTAAYCTLQVRPGGYARTPANMTVANSATVWYIQPINIGQIQANGVDIELNYRNRLFERPLNLRGLVSYEPHLRFVQPATATIEQSGAVSGNVGMTATPALRITAAATYQITEQLRLAVEERWRSKLHQNADQTVVWGYGNPMPAFAQTAFNLTYQVRQSSFGNLEFFLNVQNLFNKGPPPTSGRNGFAISDDPIGRYYTVGLHAKL